MRSLAIVAALAASLSAQGLPPQPVPPQNPITPQKAILGKLLFWEEQMSANNRVACGTCHTFAAGGGDLRRAPHPGNDGITPSPDDSFGSPGITRSDANNDYLPDPVFRLNTQITKRASPSMLTAAWFPNVFWDGRAAGQFVDPDTGVVLIPTGGALENQALAPILSSSEMGHDGRLFAEATTKLQTAKPMALATSLPPDMAAAIVGGVTYPDLFSAAFGTPDVTAARIAFALATYQRTLVPNQTPYDLFIAGNPTALTPQQVNGLNVFNGPARCNLCHVPGLFSDTQFRNIGLRPIAQDNGRQGITGVFADRGKFKVPSLRNIGLRQSFMHNGQFTTIAQVFGFYLGGGGPNLDNKDPLLLPLNGPPPGGVPPPAAADLQNFLANGLTDPRVAAGIAPFDRPVLAGDRIPPAGFLYGTASAGSGGRVPAMLAQVPPNVGNPDFKIGIAEARGGAPAVLLFGLAPANFAFSGVTILVDLPSALFLQGTLLGPVGTPGEGFASLRFGVPDLPFLVGLTMYAQWFVWDAGVPSGAATTRGAEIRFF